MKKVAIEAAWAAGRVLTSHFGKIKNIEKKHKAGLVTEVDRASEKEIIKIISKAYPNHFILSEESGKIGEEKADYRWIIDPLDGTTNYVHGLQFFCVSIALEERGKVILGVVYAPALGEFYISEKGQGAYLYKIDPSLPFRMTEKEGTRLKVSKTSKISDALIVTGFSYKKTDNVTVELNSFKKFLALSRAIRRLGSAALDLSYVARGVFDAYWERGLKPWDTAAAQLFVEEAGGKVSNFKNSTYNYYKSELAASNGLLHKAILKTV